MFVFFVVEWLIVVCLYGVFIVFVDGCILYDVGLEVWEVVFV